MRLHSGSASGDTHRKTHPKASEEAACNVGFTLEEAHEVPGHSDTPGALALGQATRARLEAHGIRIAPPRLS